MNPAGVFRDIAADAADDLGGGVRCVKQSVAGSRLGYAQVGNTRLYSGEAIVRVHLQNLVEGGEVQEYAVGVRHGARAEARGGTASNNGHSQIVADPDDGLHLLDGLRHHGHQGHFAVEHQAVALEGAQRSRVRDDAVRRKNGLQRREELRRRAGLGRNLRRKVCHWSVLTAPWANLSPGGKERV